MFDLHRPLTTDHRLPVFFRLPTTDYRLFFLLLLLAACSGSHAGAERAVKAEMRPASGGARVQTAGTLQPPLTVVWKSKLYAPLLAPPVVENGMVYLPMPDHRVYTIDLRTGVQAAFSKVGGVAQAAPVLRAGVLFLALSGRADRDQTGLLAVDLQRNRVRWQRPLPVGWSSPVLVDDTLYIGAEDDALYALDTETGDTRWRFLTKAPVRSSPAVAHGLVFVGSDDDHLYALDAEVGTLRWSFRTGGSIPAAPVVADSAVYVGSHDRTLYCLAAATGRLRWRWTTDGSLYGSPVVKEGRVFIGSNDRTLSCVDAATGTLLWRYATNGVIRGTPLLVDAVVYVGSSDKRLYALDTASGRLLWQYETGGSITVSPVVVDGLLVVGSEDRYVYAFTGAAR